MFASPHAHSRWVLIGVTALTIAGCAASRGPRLAHSSTDCPISFTLLCEARQPGARTDPAECRCVRHKDLGAWLDRY